MQNLNDTQQYRKKKKKNFEKHLSLNYMLRMKVANK